MSYACTRSSEKAQFSASKLVRPCTPQATIPTLRLSDLASRLAATAVAAPVRIAVIQLASITDIGIPLSGSFRISRPEMYGSPLVGLSGYPETHFSPAEPRLGM
jgi:hypothetical protein